MRLTKLTIDLNAIARNAAALRAAILPRVKIMAVVKANAYGHGDVDVARTALAYGCSHLGVAFAQEAEHLRVNGITAPILIMGAPEPDTLHTVVSLGIEQTVFTAEHIRALDETASGLGMMASVHIKIDTGMNRIGVMPAGLSTLLSAATASRNVRVTGAFTHLSSADGNTSDDEAYTLAQLDAFDKAAALVRNAYPEAMIHAAASAGALRYPRAAYDCVRIGIALYGAPPVPTDVPLEQAMTWSSRVTCVKEIPSGACVSYGRTYTARKPTRIATIPLGYADGYHRALSNKGQVLIRSGRAPIIGRVCMDQFMVDVTDIPDAAVGDEAVLLGRQGGDIITGDELGAWAGTISYEMFCAPSARVPRVIIPCDA